jgi:hypothetical protein
MDQDVGKRSSGPLCTEKRAKKSKKSNGITIVLRLGPRRGTGQGVARILTS